jgi:POT family proton-dependent oligopeptide transporter
MSEKSGLQNFLSSFSDLARLPRALWFVIGAFVIDTAAYYGVLTLMTVFLHSDLGWSDQRSGVTVSVFTMLVTLFMLGVGSYAERFGLRRAILFALLLTLGGRALYTLSPNLGSGVSIALIVLAALVITAMGCSIIQPVCYSGVKQYTDENTNSMGYGLIYALMNLGLVGMGALSSWIRPGVQDIKDAKPLHHAGRSILEFFASYSISGVQAVNWACVMVTGFTLLLFLVLMTKKAEAAKLRPDVATDSPTTPTASLLQRLRTFFGGGPFSNPRFIFFIFMLLPVRTLFAHQWLTFPQYILRAYPKTVADHMEQLVFWINAGIIFFGVPVATALTRHINVYKMMIIGTLVSALPTFLLCVGPNVYLLITYFVIFSIGEALWSARFMQYASELAPPGRVAQYMGLAQIPWLLAKGTTGLYSGYILSKCCPDNVSREAMHTATMWFIYGCIAITTPIGLWLAQKWVMSGLQTKPAPVTA